MLLSDEENHTRKGFEVEPEQKAIIPVHKPDIRERIFFFHRRIAEVCSFNCGFC